MRLTEYTPDAFDHLRRAAERLRVPGLCHRPFVDYYYAGNPWCRLHLLEEQGAVAGIIGLDRMRFAAGGRHVEAAFATNYHAARPGAGGYLYLHWLKTSPLGIVFGGSADTHKILRDQRWRYFGGVKTFVLDRAVQTRPWEPVWRRLAKRVLAGLRRLRGRSLARRLPGEAAGVAVHEVTAFTEDMLPRSSPFALRFDPPLDYLRWRYRPGLSFVRYRVFRVCAAGRACGYVVLNDAPGKFLVAQCDGEEPATLAYGVLRAVVHVAAEVPGPREVQLTSCHPVMQAIFKRFGFRALRAERPLAFGSRRGPVDLPAETSRWLINLDWGDNGLRAPFLDQAEPAAPGRPARSRSGHGQL